MQHLTEFAKQYKEAVIRYAKAHFENRTLNFTPNMIAISNNCTSLTDNAKKFQSDYKKDDFNYSSDSDYKQNQKKMDTAFDAVIKSFDKLKNERFVRILIIN